VKLHDAGGSGTEARRVCEAGGIALPMDHASMQACKHRGLWSSGRCKGRWDTLWPTPTSTCVSRLGFHGNSAVHGHTRPQPKSNHHICRCPRASQVQAFPPSRKACPQRRLAACLGHGAAECSTRREPTGRVSGGRHSHGLAGERSATVVVAAAACGVWHGAGVQPYLMRF
jgi:hypothetical protein